MHQSRAEQSRAEQSRAEQSRAEQSNLSSKTERIYGLDLFRILAMFMIVVTHINGHGGIQGKLTADFPLTFPYFFSVFIGYISNLGIIFFIVLSGYLNSCKKYKFSNICHIFFEIIFYSLFFFCVQYFFYSNRYGYQIIKANLFQYWFVNIYTGMFCLIPFLNKLLDYAKLTLALLFVYSLLFSILPILLQTDLFHTDGVKGLNGFIFLYLIGGVCGRYHLEEQISCRRLTCVCVLCIFISLATKFIFEYTFFMILGKYRLAGNYFLALNSPLSIIIAVSLLLLFSKLNKIPSFLKAICSIISPLMLGVYLCHDSILFRAEFILDKFTDYSKCIPAVLVFKIFYTAGIVFLVSLAVEYMRNGLFTILGEKKLIKMLDDQYFSKALLGMQKYWASIGKYF